VIALLRRLLPSPPDIAEIATAWQHAGHHPRLQLADDLHQPPPRNGDPERDPVGTNRWASPDDLYPWVKVGAGRWVHVGGHAVRSDRQVRTFQPRYPNGRPTR
jgi:hypothetical protein